jgi:hypothetical protein
MPVTDYKQIKSGDMFFEKEKKKGEGKKEGRKEEQTLALINLSLSFPICKMEIIIPLWLNESMRGSALSFVNYKNFFPDRVSLCSPG